MRIIYTTAETSSGSSVAGNVRSETRMKPAMFVLPPLMFCNVRFFLAKKNISIMVSSGIYYYYIYIFLYISSNVLFFSKL